MLIFLSTALAGPIPSDTAQLLLAIVPSEDSARGTLLRASRDDRGWHWVDEPVAARFGAAGVAWGVGLHPEQTGLQKVEGDLRSPKGVFLLGDAFRDDSVLPMDIVWPLHRIGERDLWVEDPSSPHYNQHIVVPGDRPLLPWEEAARMRLFEPVLSLKVFIAHNPAPAVAHAGSAIFLHGPADGDAPTAGCTAIERGELEEILRWLRKETKPVFVLLTERDLEQLAAPWSLPRP